VITTRAIKKGIVTTLCNPNHSKRVDTRKARIDKKASKKVVKKIVDYTDRKQFN